MSADWNLGSTLWLTPLEARPDLDLDRQFEQILTRGDVSWTVQYRLLKQLGAGSQGVVFLAERLGAHNVVLPVALKVFSPRAHASTEAYHQDMSRVARMAERLALLQHDNLLDVHNFVDCGGVSVMAMEWVDGFDLRHLLSLDTFLTMRGRVTAERWQYLNDVVITAGSTQARLKPGIAISILRECLAGVAAMHRAGIVHGDLKPANLMLKRTGNAKVIDMGGAHDVAERPAFVIGTPHYAAIEVLRGAGCSCVSDLASLGYVLVELLTGEPPFAGLTGIPELIAAKKALPELLPSVLPPEFARDESLLTLIRKLIAPQPKHRFASAEDAELQDGGFASFQRRLVRGNLSSEFDTEARRWLNEILTDNTESELSAGSSKKPAA